MTNFQQKIEEQVGTFVRSVNELIRRAAIEALEQAVVVPGLTPVDSRPQARNAGRPRRKPGLAKKPAAPREPAELAALTERLYGAIVAQPGETMEVLAPAAGCAGKQLRVSIEQLLKAERVSKAGERRSTRYFPMGADGP